MDPKQPKRIIGLILVVIVMLIGVSTPMKQIAAFPNELRLFNGQVKSVSYDVPISAELTFDPEILEVNGKSESSLSVSLKEPLLLHSSQNGQTNMKVKLFGKIPFKTVKVDVVPDLKVIPGGQTIGVKVSSDGVLVVGHHQVTDQSGTKQSPGELAGLRLGDLITGINKVKVTDIKKLGELCEKYSSNKKPLTISFLRNGKSMSTKLSPIYDVQEQQWRIGLYIRDSAAGVGTLTFYAPDQGVYGALGHVITDMDTGTPIVIGDGEILQASVTSINKSQNGDPGEKRAHFVKEKHILGNIERNTSFGIFGKMKESPSHSYANEALPVAFAEDIKEGPAYILTVVNGQKVEKFDIEVVHVTKQSNPATKGMVIKVTDERLINKTGGIVQGMSGSPIIQDGKLIGAVTHVFVNDPTSGYGCFIEWMLQDAGVLLDSSDEEVIEKAS